MSSSVVGQGDCIIDPYLVRTAIAQDDAGLQALLVAQRQAGRRYWLPVSGLVAMTESCIETTPGAGERREFIFNQAQWLASLAAEAAAVKAPRPRAAQLAIAASGLAGDAVVISRDPEVLTHVAQAVTPEQALAKVISAPVAFIDLARQQDEIRADVEQRVMGVLRHGHYIMGPEVAALEQQLAAYVGVAHCLTVASGTDSLEIALRALNIGPGDEVITVPFTWISTAEVIGLVGATPVFVDIDPVTFNIDVRQIAAAITSRTKAIMPVGLFGQMPDMVAINAIANKHNLPVIEDAAQSFGATQRGQKSCGVSTIGSTSFFPAKPLGCYGDGGALFTNDDALAARMRAIRTHGGERRHYHPYLGMNGRLDTMQAAVVLAKMTVWDAEVAARGRLGARYNDALRDVVAVPEVAPGCSHVFAQYTIRVQDREAVITSLQAAGIPTAVYYPTCLHQQPVFSGLGYAKGRFPVSEQATHEVLSLPMHPYLTESAQDRIIAAVSQAVR